MISLFGALFGWLPAPLLIIASGVFVVFLILVILRIVALILDVIPFL